MTRRSPQQPPRRARASQPSADEATVAVTREHDPDTERVGRLLEQVLELAESLPHDRVPPLPPSPFRRRG